jgi:hypothetical protein
MSATPFPVALRKSFLAPEFSFDSLEAADAAVTGYLERVTPAYAERSVLGLASDWRLFSARCHSAGTAALPAAPDTVAAYVDALATTHRPATIRRHMATISHLRLIGFRWGWGRCPPTAFCGHRPWNPRKSSATRPGRRQPPIHVFRDIPIRIR